jgi:hypothetical protein
MATRKTKDKDKTPEAKYKFRPDVDSINEFLKGGDSKNAKSSFIYSILQSLMETLPEVEELAKSRPTKPQIEALGKLIDKIVELIQILETEKTKEDLVDELFERFFKPFSMRFGQHILNTYNSTRIELEPYVIEGKSKYVKKIVSSNTSRITRYVDDYFMGLRDELFNFIVKK